ncbi:MAG: NADPH-dependent FMN reductase [Bdellovibrionales bacterium RIFCSPHIGHO2_01_FULL_40_29]|nr:MAG: NADPH-dependent FMN reductase [Bdellovibrionales bacterium RIFCSPHIGHO2_01_FULL_40_29]OFZ33197.1 MAG: NADPH-dependent FMN reductase [Bdellovibrionales bacterium RIFCSPHIGHO2_02_FULL_40_15]
MNIGIIMGSTRPGRIGEGVAKWVFEQAQTRSEVNYHLIDLLDYNLPLLDEPNPPMMGNYTKEHTKKWAAAIAKLDGFVFVTPEYNHSTSAALKNAFDYLYKEWNNKACGFVSYGSAMGARAVENLRLVAGELKMADVRNQLMLSLHSDFENYKVFKPSSHHEKSLKAVFDDVESWSGALKTIRKNIA